MTGQTVTNRVGGGVPLSTSTSASASASTGTSTGTSTGVRSTGSGSTPTAGAGTPGPALAPVLTPPVGGHPPAGKHSPVGEHRQVATAATAAVTSALHEQPVLGEPLAEAAVLGCVLRASPGQARAVLALFDDDVWSVPQHAHVAAAARALLARGEPADPVTVLGQLRRQGTENARTASTDAGVLLVELCQAAPCAGSAGHYARIVLEHAYRRRVQAAALRLLSAADTADLTDLADLVAAEHAAVARAQHRATAPALLAPPPS